MTHRNRYRWIQNEHPCPMCVKMYKLIEFITNKYKKLKEIL